MDSATTLLENAARTVPAENAEDWLLLVQEVLRLPGEYIPAVYEVLRQGRWKKANNPLGYVRVSESRMAKRMGLAEEEPVEIPISNVGPARDRAGDQAPLSHDERIDWEIERFEEDNPSYEDDWTPYARLRVAEDLRIPETEADQWNDVNWDKVAERAGLDEGERFVLILRLHAVSRDKALQWCESEAERKSLQAAWKRFNRKKTLLKGILSTKN